MCQEAHKVWMSLLVMLEAIGDDCLDPLGVCSAGDLFLVFFIPLLSQILLKTFFQVCILRYSLFKKVRLNTWFFIIFPHGKLFPQHTPKITSDILKYTIFELTNFNIFKCISSL